MSKDLIEDLRKLRSHVYALGPSDRDADPHIKTIDATIEALSAPLPEDVEDKIRWLKSGASSECHEIAGMMERLARENAAHEAEQRMTITNEIGAERRGIEDVSK